MSNDRDAFELLKWPYGFILIFDILFRIMRQNRKCLKTFFVGSRSWMETPRKNIALC